MTVEELTKTITNANNNIAFCGIAPDVIKTPPRRATT